MEEMSNGGSVNKGPQQMSSSLKDRLKRCGRYYSSPTTTKNPKHDNGFLPTPESPSSLNSNCNTPTLNSPTINGTPPCTILTPSSSEDQRDSGFDDSASLSCTPVLKARDTTHGSQPRVKRMRLSSRARFNVALLPEEVPSDVVRDEGNGNIPKLDSSIQPLNACLLEEEEEDTLRITACGDGKQRNSQSPEKNRLSGVCSPSGDRVSQSGSDISQLPSDVAQLPSDVLQPGSNVPHLPSESQQPENSDPQPESDVPESAGTIPQSGEEVLNGECQGGHSAEVVPEKLSCEELVARKFQLQKQLKEKTECLRKLRMVKLYRSKNDCASLEKLVTKWRGVCQDVLMDLHRKLPEPKPLLADLLQHLQIDQTFLRFNPEEETFY